MTIIELLQQMFNATEEQATAFTEAMKTNKIFTASEENMDIRYGKLKTQHEGVSEQLNKANATIAELQKATKGNADLQQTITTYQAENEKLKAQLQEAQIESEAKVALLAEGVKDIDYAMFKLKAKGELTMGEDGKVKDLGDKIAALKTQLPDQFPTKGQKNIIENRLPNNPNTDGDPEPKSLEEALRMTYEKNNE